VLVIRQAPSALPCPPAALCNRCHRPGCQADNTAAGYGAAASRSQTLELTQWIFWAVYQESEGLSRRAAATCNWKARRCLAQADEMEFNEDTHEVVATGNVYYHSFEKNEQIWCDRME